MFCSKQISTFEFWAQTRVWPLFARILNCSETSRLIQFAGRVISTAKLSIGKLFKLKLKFQTMHKNQFRQRLRQFSPPKEFDKYQSSLWWFCLFTVWYNFVNRKYQNIKYLEIVSPATGSRQTICFLDFILLSDENNGAHKIFLRKETALLAIQPLCNLSTNFALFLISRLKP